MSSAVITVFQRVRRRLAASTFVVLATVAGLAVGGETVRAHTDFAGSTPSAGDVIADPVEVVTLSFTGAAEETGDGFVVLDASGQIRRPSSVSTPDDMVFTLTFDPPLTGGQIGVRWNVRAPDGHPIEGAFAFTVTAPPTTAPPTTAPPTSASAAAAPPTTPVETTTPATAAPSTTDPASAAMPDHDMSQMTPDEMASMQEFLAVESDRPGQVQATLGRLASFLGVTLAIGGIAFLWAAFRGERAEIRTLAISIRILGGVVAVGAAVEYGGVARIAGESLGDAWSSSPGFAAALRLVAGVAVAVGLATTAVTGRPTVPARTLSSALNTTDIDGPELTTTAPRTSAAAAGDPSMSRRDTSGEPMQRWVPQRSSTLALAGCCLMVVSFWFDGHTVSEGWRPLHAVSNSVHIVAGSIWMGGVVAMAAVMWTRRRRGVPSRALDLVVRFSTVAASALAAVIVAGSIMAVSILDSFGDLTGSEWGQLFLLKTGAAGLAMLAGGYNHVRLLPALEAAPDDPALRDRLRSVVTAEAIMLTFVVIVTAWLVTAAT